jgi:hypothetical protein
LDAISQSIGHLRKVLILVITKLSNWKEYCGKSLKYVALCAIRGGSSATTVATIWWLLVSRRLVSRSGVDLSVTA